MLEPTLFTSVVVDSGNVEPVAGPNLKAVDVAPLDDNLLDAVLRLVKLTDNDRDYPALAPLVTREIIYRLIVSNQGKRLRHLAQLGGQAHRISEAIKTIRARFDEPLRVDDIASQLRMSTSGFHAHFKAVTAMSPLQFQKQLGLAEARLLSSPRITTPLRQDFASVTTILRNSAASTSGISAPRPKPMQHDFED